MFAHMLCCLRPQHCVDLCLVALLLFLAGLQQVEAAAAADMATLNWKPFIYGGMASIVAEFGRLPDAPRHANPHRHACDDILDHANVNSCLKIKISTIRFWLMMHLAQQSVLMKMIYIVRFIQNENPQTLHLKRK